jgi:RHS repeat-associated protein
MAQRKGSGETFTLSYIHQDSLGSSNLTTDGSATEVSRSGYKPFGENYLPTGTMPTDKKFTGQRLDSTGLYYYGARYYDPEIGRFISADTVVPSPTNPQSLNRYSYCLNNPLKMVDPSGHWPWDSIVQFAAQTWNNAVNTVVEAWNYIAPVAEPVINFVAFVLPFVFIFVNPEPAIAESERIAPMIEQKAVAMETKIAATAESVISKFGTAITEASETRASQALVPWVDSAGRPPNLGAIGAWTQETLGPGTVISRIGGEGGRFTSPLGTPVSMRSIEFSSRTLPETQYKVISALDVQKSYVAPWYNQIGFGTQYRLPARIDQLIAEGYLERITK